MALSFGTPYSIQARVKELAFRYIQQSKFRAYDNELPQRLQELASSECTPLSLSQAYAFGKNPSKSIRLRNSQYLHRELPIRISQRIQELKNFPHGLSQTPEIQQVIQWYTQYGNDLIASAKPMTLQEDERFTELLSMVLIDNTTVPRALSLGIATFRDRMVKENLHPQSQHWRIYRDIDERLRAFYTARIGIRFLIEQHILSKNPRAGWAGIVQNECDAMHQGELAIAAASQLCTQHMGVSPAVQLEACMGEGGHAKFTYVPSHLQYMLTELLKNSFRAVMETHHPLYKDTDFFTLSETDQATLQLEAQMMGQDGMRHVPPVKMIVTKGHEDVVIKIADEGGGVSREQLRDLWHFFYTTANRPKVALSELKSPKYSFQELQMEAEGELNSDIRAASKGPKLPALAGYGVGLPLSRVMAEYFGGALQLKSMEGFGMDSYLYLNRLGQNCENLPPKVLESPSQHGITNW
eukprot:CAMPEP_0117754928 /NCGR_PEP_ID=MMETSP0947-20121206/13142_1 /TAXON_ID=44440 /ORGANISM="Chattonella subsalsa, Strain CCMP2191" /LENGTH=467 /DNA_ID=CAMNT_0005574153 /DNA_START=167 /DNA_END=1567 /DNA_ORIENTATION=-